MRKATVFMVSLLLNAPAVGEESVQKDLKRFTGTWKVQSTTVTGRALLKAETSQNDQVVYDGDGGWQQRSEGQIIYTGLITSLDVAAKHKTIDYKVAKGGTHVGKIIRAIYEFVDEDTYRICYKGPGGERPTDFTCKKGSGDTVCVLKRQKD